MMNEVLVHPCQEQNPLLNHLKKISWQFNSEIIPDFLINECIAILYLSLKFHQFNEDYIHSRLRTIPKNYFMKVLILNHDSTTDDKTMANINEICLNVKYQLLVSWGLDEAANYITTLKLNYSKSADKIKESISNDPLSQIVDIITSIKGVTKTDVSVLLKNFKSLKNISNATVTQLSFCQGIGLKKANRIYKAFNDNW